MELTPIDIQQQKFKIRFRGFDIREVDGFLETVSDTFDKLYSENESLRENVKHLEKEVEGHKAQENAFRQVMIKSQKMIEQMEESAKKSADKIIRDSENNADRIIRDAEKESDAIISDAKNTAAKIDNDIYTRLNKMEEEIASLKRRKTQAEVEIRSLLESHLKLLDMEADGANDHLEQKFKSNLMLLKKSN